MHARSLGLAASFIRGGTSKGVFLRRDDLPKDISEWKPILLGIMGSPDPEYGRQLNGMGGGVSSLSKVCVVGAPSSELRELGVEVDFTFVQVGIRDDAIDISGNCGNLSSMIGAYALDEGIVDRRSGLDKRTVRSFNTNTQKIIDTTFPVDDDGRPQLDLLQASVAGVPGKASEILLDFVNPAGARTGKLLPTGTPVDRVNSLFPLEGYIRGEKNALDEGGRILEDLRREGARKMGLDPTAQAQPKIAMLSLPEPEDDADIVVHALSMGVLHKAVPMTLGLCLGVAANVEGTIAHSIAQQARAGQRREFQDGGLVRIRHPGGTVDVGAEFADDGYVKSARVVRTGRILMKGTVFY
ncbi:DUF453-domain-containing protein [Schizophyllum commune Loenen D]|nr:DUF453-domain-containing protein [Schizophyllum commune Loenen D]